MLLVKLEMVSYHAILLSQIMIIDYKLTYPSGTATAVLINGFHTPKGDEVARYTSVNLNSLQFNKKLNSSKKKPEQGRILIAGSRFMDS